MFDTSLLSQRGGGPALTWRTPVNSAVNMEPCLLLEVKEGKVALCFTDYVTLIMAEKSRGKKGTNAIVTTCSAVYFSQIFNNKIKLYFFPLLCHKVRGLKNKVFFFF